MEEGSQDKDISALFSPNEVHGAPVESGSREVKVRFRLTVLFKWRTKQNKTCLCLAGGQMSKKLVTEGEGPKDIIDK